jgi:hypothetical protein
MLVPISGPIHGATGLALTIATSVEPTTTGGPPGTDIAASRAATLPAQRAPRIAHADRAVRSRAAPRVV